MHMSKYLNIKKYNEENTLAIPINSISAASGEVVTFENAYDSGCWAGSFSDTVIADKRK